MFGAAGFAEHLTILAVIGFVALQVLLSAQTAGLIADARLRFPELSPLDIVRDKSADCGVLSAIDIRLPVHQLISPHFRGYKSSKF